MATCVSMSDYVPPSSPGKSESTTKSVPVPPSPGPEWGIDSVPIKDFAGKRTVPGFAKVVKGTYMTLGSSKFSFQKQHHEVFIHSVKVAVKVLAHSVRRVDAAAVSKRSGHSVVSRMYAVDQRLAIPISYQGWFELLSEDGKSARHIASVHELSKVKPKKFLIRENTKAYIINDETKLTFDKTRIVLAGEHLVVSGELSLPSPNEKKRVKLLRCFDSKGERIYLSFDQKGLFTPIAGENDVTGVFLIRDVVQRFRLPLTVKLVQGMRPKVDPTRFTGLIRLDWVYTDETAFVCPIEKNQIRLMPVPTDVSLQLVSAVNQEDMKSTELYQNMSVKCNRMISNYNNTIHLIVSLPEAVSKGKGKANSNMFSIPLAKSSQDIASKSKPRSEARQTRLMEEIDDLYGYVRDGGAIPHKFEYDSDEESFWEEPAYEPLDEFRARLKALEAGEKVTYNSKYQPQDFGKLKMFADAGGKETESTYGVFNGAPAQQFDGTDDIRQPPPLPPRLPPTPPDTLPPDAAFKRQGSESSGGKDSSSSGARRRSEQLQMEGFITSVSSQGIVSSYQIPPSSNISGGGDVQTQRRHSKGSDERQRRLSRGSGGEAVVVSSKREAIRPPSGNSDHLHNSRLLARDFRDSDISSVTKTSSGSSGGRPVGHTRRKLQTLYL